MKRATRVYFVNVGRAKRSWSVDMAMVPADDMEMDLDGLKLPTMDWIAAEAKRGGSLMSNDVWAHREAGGFLIAAGMHTVGSGYVEVTR